MEDILEYVNSEKEMNWRDSETRSWKFVSMLISETWPNLENIQLLIQKEFY